MSQYSQESNCVPESLFKLQLSLNRDSGTGVFLWILQDTSGWLLLFHNSCWLYTLQLHISGNFQGVKGHISREKKSSIYFKDFRDLDFIYTIFFRFLWQMPVYLFGYAKRMLYCAQPTILLARRYLKTMLLTNFENLNSIPNTSQATRDFLVLKDPVINIYLRTTDRHFCDQGTVLHHTSKLLKGDLVQT